MTVELEVPNAQTILDEVVPRYAARVELALGRCLPGEVNLPSMLHQAMRYSVLGGGKRLRALLVYSGGLVCGADLETLDGPACAVELLHAYSLIHDDLPAMDDDDLRRGKPSCHMAFDEATAVLAGDALQALAFEVLTDHSGKPPPGQRLELIARFAAACGSRGMVGGQAIDLAAEGMQLAMSELETMHSLKTGALIRASVCMGALCAVNLEREQLGRLDEFARCVGLAFQIRDDILDIEGDTATLGKPQGSDEALYKSTYPGLVGIAESKRMAQSLHERALLAVSGFDDRADPLRALSKFAITRSN